MTASQKLSKKVDNTLPTNSNLSAKRKATPASYKKGQSGNLKGRPVQPWRKVFEMETEKLVKTKDGKQKIKHLMAKAQIGEALKGDTHAFNAVADRMEGRPIQPTDVTTGGEKLEGITVTIVEDKSEVDHE